ncbi:metallophosphoesterase family protein [Kozakia baliensis]|uniref:metallophosphoesterase family protein n=1 Tax=Kozakia baliensis TaxID=153496 RepID=UPI00087BCA85|nr:metallophosphoesterase [Kozakia baliensis]AOX19371.1 metallophosphoesterase [Kozakia baliensis]
MIHISRRAFLSLTGGMALTSATGALGAIPQRPPLRTHEPFSFLFLTDTHLQPELNANQGCHMAFAQARKVPADFAIQGGDHVFDALGVNAGRATMLMDLYKRTAEDLTLPVHHTIGNHDCFGVYTQSGAHPTDPFYGKKYFEDNFGQLYYSFNHKGVHFVILDSIGITADRSYEGRIDAAQIAWLARDLAAQPTGTPIVVISHIPLVTAVEDYAAPSAKPPAHHGISVVNAYEVLPLFDHYNVIGVLQGHTHILERIDWHGVPYITGGAVSGNWWHGTRYGTPEGFMVVDIADGALRTRYETYGFKTIDPHNT